VGGVIVEVLSPLVISEQIPDKCAGLGELRRILILGTWVSKL
jgi:hypothetical protein